VYLLLFFIKLQPLKTWSTSNYTPFALDREPGSVYPAKVFGVCDLGIAVKGLGFRVWGAGLGFRCMVWPGTSWVQRAPGSALRSCEDRVLDGPASGDKAPRVRISSTVFGVRA